MDRNDPINPLRFIPFLRSIAWKRWNIVAKVSRCKKFPSNNIQELRTNIYNKHTYTHIHKTAFFSKPRTIKQFQSCSCNRTSSCATFQSDSQLNLAVKPSTSLCFFRNLPHFYEIPTNSQQNGEGSSREGPLAVASTKGRWEKILLQSFWNKKKKRIK